MPVVLPIKASESSDAMKGTAQVTMSTATNPESNIVALPLIIITLSDY
jgi:hypothetical protein